MTPSHQHCVRVRKFSREDSHPLPTNSAFHLELDRKLK